MSASENLPPVTVVIVTYDRPREVRLVIRSLMSHLRYDGELRWHLADDGTPGDYIKTILADFPQLGFTYTVPPWPASRQVECLEYLGAGFTDPSHKADWGANVNRALEAVQSHYVFLNEDDYVAMEDIDLTSGVWVLERVPNVGLIRYDGLSGHLGVSLKLREVRTPRGRETVLGTMTDFLEIDRHLSNHLNCYSHRPHLVHAGRFHRAGYGFYKEGVSLGACESEFAQRFKQANGGPEIAILDSGVKRKFQHIGESRQRTALDRC